MFFTGRASPLGFGLAEAEHEGKWQAKPGRFSSNSQICQGDGLEITA